MTKKKVSEMTGEEKLVKLTEAKEGLKEQIEKLKKDHKETKKAYAEKMQKLVDDPSNFKALDAWQAFRLSLNIMHCKEAFEHYEAAMKAKDYESYIDKVRLVVIEISDIPYVLDEDDEDTLNEARLFIEAFNMGYITGVRSLSDKLDKKK